ncbi:MAG: hypothetical protein SGILL_006351, partial [Bacillariaceae sp.]
EAATPEGCIWIVPSSDVIRAFLGNFSSTVIPAPVFKPSADVVALYAAGNFVPANNAEGWVFADGTPVPFPSAWTSGDPNNGGGAGGPAEPYVAITNGGGLLMDVRPDSFTAAETVAFYQCCTPVAEDTCTELTAPVV